jgi:protocatechuate 3,4-dioxygenase beta subunit
MTVPRRHVLGERLPDGAPDPVSRRGVDWVGVANLEADDFPRSRAADETKDAVTTAVVGFVVDESGEPLAGAEVVLYSTFYLRQAYYDHRVRQIGRAFTDREGAFDLRPVDLDTVHFGADGEVLVTVRHLYRADVVAQPLRGVQPGRVSDVGRLVLPAAGVRVHGTVRDLEGKPVAGAAVRASGAMNPTEYDKVERMVVLDDCPTAFTDPEGRYELTDVAPGRHELSVHVNVDCVVHAPAELAGEVEWSPRVRAGNAVRGRVLDPAGEPVAAAVVVGGSNWTPTHADGSFWLDNVDRGPLAIEVWHHAWRSVRREGVPTNGSDVVIAFERPLSRVALTVVRGGEPATLIAIDWTWPEASGPGLFAPDSRFWQSPDGVFDVAVPERATGATVSTVDGSHVAPLAAEALTDGARLRIVLGEER